MPVSRGSRAVYRSAARDGGVDSEGATHVVIVRFWLPALHLPESAIPCGPEFSKVPPVAVPAAALAILRRTQRLAQQVLHLVVGDRVALATVLKPCLRRSGQIARRNKQRIRLHFLPLRSRRSLARGKQLIQVGAQASKAPGLLVIKEWSGRHAAHFEVLDIESQQVVQQVRIPAGI